MKKVKRTYFIYVISAFLVFPFSLSATDYYFTGAINNDWNTAGNWRTGVLACLSITVPGVIPTAADNVTICPTKTCNLSAAGVCLNLTIYGTLGQGANTLTVSGNYVLDPLGSHTGSGTITFNGNGKTITCTNSAAYTATGAWTIANNITVAATTNMTMGTGLAGYAIATTVNATTFTVAGNLNVASGSVGTSTASALTCSITISAGGTLTLTGNPTAGNCTVSKGVITNNGSLLIKKGKWDANGTGTYPTSSTVIQGPNSILEVATGATTAAFQDCGTNVNTVRYVNSGAVSIGNPNKPNSGDFYNFEMAGAGTASFTNGANIYGTLTATSGTLSCNSRTISMYGSGDVWVNNASVTWSSGTLAFRGGNNQTIGGTVVTQSLNNLTVNKTGGTVTKAAGSSTTALSLSGNYTSTAGSFDASGLNISLSGNWVINGGTFSPGTQTVTFIGGSASTLGGTSASNTFYNLTINKNAGIAVNRGGSLATITCNDYTNTLGNFNISAATTFNVNSTSGSDVVLTAGTFSAPPTVNVTGNWTNDGGTFTTGTGTVNFTGTLEQAVGGTAASSTFYNLAVANSSATGVRLSKNVILTNLLTLTDGKIYTAASPGGLLILNSGASSGSGSANSFVDGPMKKIGNTAFIFPIGDGVVWARAGISNIAGGGAADEYIAEYFYSPAPNANNLPASGIDHVSNTEYWDVAHPVGTATSTDVSFYWEDADRSGITNISGDLINVHYNTSTSLWENKVGTIWPGSTIGPGGNGYITAAWTSFSPGGFGSGGGGNPLPVELLGFQAVPFQNKVVNLSWATSTEINNDYFTVERSADGINFETVATVKGSGNSSVALEYQAIDHKPLQGVSYYRLKQTDFDGKYSYSSIVPVRLEQNTASFTLYPNPALAGERFSMYFENMPQKEILVVVYDITGKEFYSKITVKENDGEHIIAVDNTGTLTPGIYFVAATSEGQMFQQKLVIK